jgi:hypothetical protein
LLPEEQPERDSFDNSMSRSKGASIQWTYASNSVCARHLD